MSLPPIFSTAADYFKDSLDFLNKCQWLYNYPNTHILVKDVLTNFPREWCDYFESLPNDELNRLPLNDFEKCPPQSLKELLSTIDGLKPNLDTASFENDDDVFSHNCCLSDKKRHEVVILAPVISRVSIDSQTNLIVDIGSGLGYLSHHLHSKYNLKVLGIECSKQYIEQAYKIQQKVYPNCLNEVKFVEHYIDADSVETITSLIQQGFIEIEPKYVSLVGLHACADLSVTVLDLFSRLEFVKSLTIMPCCYHRLKLKEEQNDKEWFYNFPVSTVFKRAFKESNAEYFLRRPFLRLACQQAFGNFANMSEEQHLNHSKNLMFRCILQLVAESENLDVKRVKRKSTPSHTSNLDFEDYLTNLSKTHQLKPRKANHNSQLRISDEPFLRKMRETWLQYKEKCYLLEVLTGFQSSLQSVCENLILLDRVEYLKENGFQACIQKVTDDIVSPRCYALIATK